MANITYPNVFVSGNTILASEMNANFNAITAQVNGSLDSANLANGAVDENQLATDSVATAKIQDLAVTTGKIALDAVDATVIADGAIANVAINAAAAIDATKIADGSVTSTEFQYLNGVTSAIQTQFASKQATITGAATTITSSNLTANRAVVSNGSGKVAVSAVTDTELGYLDGVTSAIQTQLDNKLGTTATAADSSELGGVAASGYLRSDASDTYSTGNTLTMSGTLDASGGTLVLPTV